MMDNGLKTVRIVDCDLICAGFPPMTPAPWVVSADVSAPVSGPRRRGEACGSVDAGTRPVGAGVSRVWPWGLPWWR